MISAASMAGTTAPDWVGPAIMLAILLACVLVPAAVLAIRNRGR